MSGTGTTALSLREATRGLVRHKSIFCVAVLTLALGLSLCTTMFCVLYGVILRPLSYADKDKLVIAWAAYEGGATERDTFTEQALEEWRQGSQAFAGLAAFRYAQFTLLQRGDPSDFEAAYVSPELFSVMGARAEIGSALSPELARSQQGKVVVLSHWLWEQRFGADRTVPGKSVDLGGDTYTIAGVMPKDFDVPSAEVAMWAPLPAVPSASKVKSRNLMLIGQLKPAVGLARGQADADVIAHRLAGEYKDTHAGMRIHLVPFFDELIKDSRPFVLVASAAALLVLLICCANLSNLLLVRAIERRPELDTRLAIGAQRRHLLGTVFAEGLLLAICGGLAGAVLARWMIEALLRNTPIELPRGATVGHGLQIPLIAGGLILIAALLISVLPAWEVARSRRSQGAGKGSRSTSRRFARQLIATVEIAIALTLLAGAGLMARTMSALRNTNPGWRSDHLLVSEIFLPTRRYPKARIQQFFETFIENLRAAPGVVSVAASSAVPAEKMGIDIDLPIQLPGRSQDDAGRAAIRSVTPGFFKTMGIPVIQGRDFDDGDRDPKVKRVIVNQSFAKRYFPDSPSVLGKQVGIFVTAMATYEVIGEVGDVYHYGVLREPKPEFYLPFAVQPFSGLGVVVRTQGDPLAFAPTLRQKLWAQDAQLPVAAVESMDKMVKDTWSDRSFLTILLIFLSAVAVALTIIGVFSVVRFSVSRQVKEIGIRMAMGARQDDVVRLVMGQSARTVAAGVALGLAGAWLLGRWIASLMFKVSATDPWVLLAGALGIGLVACLGAYLPSRRAARIDPMAALRVE